MYTKHKDRFCRKEFLIKYSILIENSAIHFLWFLYRNALEVKKKTTYSYIKQSFLSYLWLWCFVELVNRFLWRKFTWSLIYTKALCFCGILTIIDDWKQSQFLCLWLKNMCFLFNFSCLSINKMIIHRHFLNNATWL